MRLKPTVTHLSLSAVLSFSLLSGCQSESISPETRSDSASRQLLVSLSHAEQEVVKSDNNFGFRLFASLAKDDPGSNIIVSPVSVSLALTMAYNGARNTTQTVMASQLGYAGMDRAAVNSLFAKLIPALKAADGKVQLQIANSVWSDIGLDVEPQFLELNRATFAAETRTLDFSAPAAAPTINDWVNINTKGLIPTVVPEPLPPDWVMVLINALYFKGSWSQAFKTDRTYNAEFHLASGAVKTCRMMHADTNFRVFSDGKVNALELPYGDSLFSMVFLQTAAPEGLPAMIADLDAGAWDAMQDKFKVREGPIHVPKFKLEYAKSLAAVLQAMGMAEAFSGAADFTGIRKAGDLTISDVIHKTYVNVDEEGTEAAAVTAVAIKLTAMPMDLIRLDRPFVFVLREKTSGTILFLGRIMDPTL
ncbi:MAG: serpin family protein [Fibrobacteria bacterium]